MKIKDLKIGDKAVSITVQIKEIAEVREFERKGTTNRMATALVEDTSGEIDMPLFNEDLDTLKVGDIVKVINGYVGEFNDIKQLRSGMYGRIEILKTTEEKKDPGELLKKKKNGKTQQSL